MNRATHTGIDGKGEAPATGQAAFAGAIGQGERALLERAIANARNGIILTDNRHPENPIVYANDAFAELIGYDYDEILGRNCRFLQGPDTDPGDRRRLRRAIERGEGIHLEILNYRKDGSAFWNNLLISPLRDDDGRVTHFVGNQIDVTARREAEAALLRERAGLEGQVLDRTRALAEERDESRAIAETVREPLLVLDDDLIVRWANHAFYTTFRVAPAATEGQHLFALGNGQWDIPRLRELLERVLPEREALDNFEVEHIFPALGRRIMLLNARRVRLRDGQEGQILLAMQDVTEQMQSARSLERQSALTSAILTSLPAHIAVLSQNGTIIAVNEAWDNFAAAGGVPIRQGAFIGVNYLDTLRNVGGDDAEDALRSLGGVERVLAREQRSFSLEYPCDIPGVGQYWFLLQVVPLRHADGGAVVMHLDITERKQIEQRKDDFISMASHELKTPVTGLQLGAQVLQRRLTRLGLADEAHTVERLRGQITRLNRLVEELLDVSRINIGKLAIVASPDDLASLARETVELLQLSAAGHMIALTTPDYLPTLMDRDRITQVLINLIGNAIKFSPEGSAVEVSLAAEGDKAAVRVRDYGSGISPEHQAHIFERFYQAPTAPGQNYPGLGMGLHISSEIVKRHGGRIWVESAVGEGATFRFTLPLVAAEE